MGALFSPRLDPEEYRRDCNRVRDFYRSKGFLDVEVLELDPAKACTIKDLKGKKVMIDTPKGNTRLYLERMMTPHGIK